MNIQKTPGLVPTLPAVVLSTKETASWLAERDDAPAGLVSSGSGVRALARLTAEYLFRRNPDLRVVGIYGRRTGGEPYLLTTLHLRRKR